MWYHFDVNGNCVCSSSSEINPMDNIVESVWNDTEYDDIYNLRLIDGNLVHTGDDSE